MSNEYTPSLNEVRYCYKYGKASKCESPGDAHFAFERMIAEVRAEAQAEALEEAAYEIDQIDTDGDTALWLGPEQNYTLVSDWLRARAAQLKDKP